MPCQVGTDNPLLVDLTHLHTVSGECLEKATQTVAHYAMDGETVLLKPLHALHIVCHGLVPDVLVPQDLATQGVPDDHQTVVLAPVGRIQLDHHILVAGYHTDMAHLTQSTLYRAYTFTVFDRQFLQSELMLNVIGYDVVDCQTIAANKTTIATLAFI